MVEAGKNGRPHEQPAVAQPTELTPEYLATLVHQLRNPLAPIRNATQLLRSLCTDPRQMQAIDMISRQVVNLTQMLEDVTEAARSQRSVLSLTRQTVDVAQIVEPALNAIRSEVDERRQSLFVSLPSESVEMHCDPVRLAQVLQTLLNNASRHTPEAGAIALKVWEDGAHLLAEISDNGAGLPADRISSVFNVFAERQQGREPTTQAGGYNLAIARNIVEMHGGKITAESAGIGRGSKFTVRLPLEQPPEAPQPTPTAAMPGARRILIIEDHADNAQSLSQVLARGGHSVLSAGSGELGVALAKQFKPEAVIIDIGLPGIDGFEVAERLRSQPETANALLLAMSGFSFKQFRDLEAYAVFRHYLLKPTSPDTVLHIIEHTLDEYDRKKGPR